MTKNTFYRNAFAILAATAALSLISCSREPATDGDSSAPVWQRHIPGNSDLLVVADMDAMKKSDWYRDAYNNDDSRNSELRTKAGFSQDDVSLLIAASDLDAFPPIDDLKNIASVSPTNAAALQDVVMPSLNATVLLLLNKSISWQQVRTAVDVLFSDTTNATIRAVDGRDQVIITQTSSSVPLNVTLVENGYILKLTTYESMAADTNSLAPLFSADQSVEANGPIRISVNASEAMRTKIKESIESALAAPSKDATSLMLASLMKSFVSFTGLAITLNPGETGTDVFGAFDMGTAENATSAEAVIQTVLIPLITLSMTQYTSEDSPPVMQDTTTSVQGTRVILRTKLNAQGMELPTASADGEG